MIDTAVRWHEKTLRPQPKLENLTRLLPGSRDLKVGLQPFSPLHQNDLPQTLAGELT